MYRNVASKWALDNMVLFSTISKFFNEKKLKSSKQIKEAKNTDGLFVEGLFMEGHR